MFLVYMNIIFWFMLINNYRLLMLVYIKFLECLERVLRFLLCDLEVGYFRWCGKWVVLWFVELFYIVLKLYGKFYNYR